MSELGEAIEFRLRMGEEAQRQLDMLRVTLGKRMADAADTARGCADEDERAFHEGRGHAYEDVLSLLGPEPAWYTDPDTSEPF